ncbi:MAG: SH3 domain-containing protein, partial [Pirellulales bacterium]
MNRPLLAWPLWLLPLLLHLALLHSPVVAAEEAEAFPYTAVVTTDDVYVRSGPGKNYYPTSKMQGGEQVEVYRHDPGGWFAIRPPQDSFSWVPAKLLQLRDDKLAEVLEDQTPAHVGSLFSDVRDVRQVRLKKGETVEVLGQKRFVDQQAGVTETWYQIAPPAGEFRWIYGTLLSRDTPRPPAVEREARVQIPLGKQETDNDARTERKRLIARQYGIEVEPVADDQSADSLQVVMLDGAGDDSAVEVRLADAT